MSNKKQSSQTKVNKEQKNTKAITISIKDNNISISN